MSTPDGWRLIGEHTAAVLKDPPAIALSPEALSEYEGVYSLTPEIKTTVRSRDGGLTSQRDDRPTAMYAAEFHDVFFVPGQPRTRRIFTRDANGRVDGFVDRREGEDIRWVRDQAKAPVGSQHSPAHSNERPVVLMIRCEAQDHARLRPTTLRLHARGGSWTPGRALDESTDKRGSP